jgi:hypothetical protein
MSFQFCSVIPRIAFARASFSPGLRGQKFYGAGCASYGKLLSRLPHLLRNCALLFSSFISLKPLSRFRELFSSLIKVETPLLPMSLKMVRARHHFQVVDLIIFLVSIFVMNIKSWRYRPKMVNPNPSLSMNGHSINPIASFIPPEPFPKVNPINNPSHGSLLVCNWLVKILHSFLFFKPFPHNKNLHIRSY